MKRSCCILLMIIVLYVAVSSSEAQTIRIGVAEFVNKTSTVETNLNAAEIFAGILSASSSAIEVVESKTLDAISAVNTDNAAKAGKTAKCDYVLLGVLMNDNTKSSLSYSLFTLKDASQEKTVTIEARLIEVKTGKIILSVFGTGTASLVYNDGKINRGNKKKNLEKLNQEIQNMNLRALYSASSMVSEKICAYLAGEYPEVVSVIKTQSTGRTQKKGRKDCYSIKINRGTSSGIYPGTIYREYFYGNEVFDFNGQSLGREKFNIAIAEVKEARENYSIAEIIAGAFDNIKEGDKAEQITRKEAQQIIDRNDFMKNRHSDVLR